MTLKQDFVRSLTCKRDLEMALIAYNSFLKLNQDNCSLIIHSDGSLSKADIDNLYKSLKNIEVIDRLDSNEEVNDNLAKYPNCLKLRELHPLSIKLLDIPILEKKCVKFIDCDILFIKPFQDLYSNDYGSRYCWEDDSGYSGRLIDILKASSGSVPEGCNTGIFQMDKNKFDIEFIEWFLGQEKLCQFPGMIEQTVYAILMGSDLSHAYERKQISTSKNHLQIFDETVAIHFMYDLKSQFFDYVDKNNFENNIESETFRLIKPKKLNYQYIIKRAIKRKFAKNFIMSF